MYEQQGTSKIVCERKRMSEARIDSHECGWVRTTAGIVQRGTQKRRMQNETKMRCEMEMQDAATVEVRMVVVLRRSSG